MKVENKTTLPLQLDDLLSKQSWEVEYRGLNLPIKLMQPLGDWKAEVHWHNGKHPFHGKCQPSQKLITIAINKNINYPFTHKFAVGTKQKRGFLFEQKLFLEEKCNSVIHKRAST